MFLAAVGDSTAPDAEDDDTEVLKEARAVNLHKLGGADKWLFMLPNGHFQEPTGLPLLDGIGLLSAQVHCGKLVNLLVQKVVREIRSESHPTSFSSTLLQHLHGPAACSGDAVGAGVEVAGGLEPGEEPGR